MKGFNLQTLRRDAFAGSITGALAIPLTIGICMMSEYPIQIGLITVAFACVMGFVVSLFKPGNYIGTPGVAAGLAPILAMSVHKFGMENMPFLILLTAIFQAIIWRFNYQRFIMKAIPAYLIEGLLAGIGLKIALKFLPYTYDVLAERSLFWTNERYAIVFISMVSMVLFLYLFNKYKNKYPAAPYLAILLSSILLAQFYPIPMLAVETVDIKFIVPIIDFETVPPSLLVDLVFYAMMLAVIDVIEQVMSNSAIDKLDPYQRKSNSNNSLLAIWLSNLGASFFGGMTNLDGLAKSATNALAGAVSKLSNVFTGLIVFLFVIFPNALTYLPEYSLAILMIFTGWKMIAGLAHVASHGQYALLLALFCGVLVFQLGIFEGLMIVLLIHIMITLFIYHHEHISRVEIFKRFISRFTEPIHKYSTETAVVSLDRQTGGLRYASLTPETSAQKDLTGFLEDWAMGVNKRNLFTVVSTYDYQGLLWGTFAKELRVGHSQIKKYFEHLFELEELHVHFDSSHVRQYGHLYIQSGKYTFTFKQKNETISIPARYSFLCTKEKSSWYILEHHSSQFPS